MRKMIRMTVVSIGITSETKVRKLLMIPRRSMERQYYFNEDGEMLTGWHQDGDDAFYLGGEDEAGELRASGYGLRNPDSTKMT